MLGADQRIVEGGLDAEAREEAGAESAHRPVNGIDDEDVVARFDEGEDRGEAGRRARAEGDRAMPALDRRDRFLEGEARRRAVPAIGDLVVAIAPGRLVGGDGRIKNCRGVVDRRVDDAEILLRLPARHGPKACRFLRFAAHRSVSPCTDSALKARTAILPGRSPPRKPAEFGIAKAAGPGPQKPHSSPIN